jgi:hypothetical protein
MPLTLHRPRSLDASMLPVGLGGLAAGAALVYWLDPERGARRRAELRQKALHATKETAIAAGVAARDAAHRGQGLLAETRASIGDSGRRLLKQPEDNDVLVERVRARLGHICSFPAAIEVKASAGRVELRGRLLESEHARVLRGVSKVRGVLEVDNHLDTRKTIEEIPGMQEAMTRFSERRRAARPTWSPSARLLLGVVGVVLAAGAIARGRHFLGKGR